jgi:excisionase family DNA binding protein
MSSNIRINRICQFCKIPFEARTTVTKYCSHRCASKAYKARNRGQDIERSITETEQTVSLPIVKIQTKDFLSVDESAKLLGLSRWTLTRAIKEKRLKAVRFGKRIVIKRTEIDSLFL